jgi:hypothetical protein
MGIECPKSGECVVIITEVQRRQLEKKGLKAKALTGLRPDKGPNQVEYKLVKEVDLSADGVETIVFGPKKDKSSTLSEIFLGLKDEGKGWDKVYLYDFNFHLFGEMHLCDVTFSKNLRYIGGIKYIKVPSTTEDTLPPLKVMYKFQLFDYTGKKLWELEERELYEVNSTYSISNKGTVIELDHGSGVVTFFDQNGNETRKIKVCNSQGTPGEGIGGGIFSENGEYVLIIADEGCRDTVEENVRVFFFTWDGKELWRTTTEENSGGGTISKQGNYVIVSSLVWPSSNYPPDKRSTYLLSKRGDLIKKYENLLGSLICFSSNERYALFDSYGTLFLIELPSGEFILKYDPKRGFYQVNSLDIAEDAKMFGLISGFGGENIQVFLIGFDGGKVWANSFPFEGGGQSLRLSDDGKQMVVQTGTKIMIYQQVE